MLIMLSKTHTMIWRKWKNQNSQIVKPTFANFQLSLMTGAMTVAVAEKIWFRIGLLKNKIIIIYIMERRII